MRRSRFALIGCNEREQERERARERERERGRGRDDRARRIEGARATKRVGKQDEKRHEIRYSWQVLSMSHLLPLFFFFLKLFLDCVQMIELFVDCID